MIAGLYLTLATLLAGLHRVVAWYAARHEAVAVSAAAELDNEVKHLETLSDPAAHNKQQLKAARFSMKHEDAEESYLLWQGRADTIKSMYDAVTGLRNTSLGYLASKLDMALILTALVYAGVDISGAIEAARAWMNR